MVFELRQVGIDVIFHFPGSAMLTRFIKQMTGGYNSVPRVVRDLPKFKALWNGVYNVFDMLNKLDVQLQFTAPTNNMDGMQIPNGINIEHGPYSNSNESEKLKFKAYIKNVRSDTTNLIVLAMTGNHMFPIR